jgi:putative membrane protein
LVFHTYSHQIFSKLFPGLLGMGILTAIIAYVKIDVLKLEGFSSIAVHSMMAFVLGLFLVFRTNTAYDRWWEGRKMWGSLVNNSRNMAFKVNAFVKDGNTRTFFRTAIPWYARTIKEHLRQGITSEDQREMEDDVKGMSEFAHKPNALVKEMYERVNLLYTNGGITGDQLFLLDKELKSLSDILGACERIRNTPIPYSYSMYLKKFIFLYTVTLPFGFVGTFGYWTIPVVMIIFYILVSIELIAEEIEDPFGRDDNDLPTDVLCDKIRDNVEEILN